MMSGHLSHDSREHRAVSALIPWYVNGTLGERDRQRVEAHLELCAHCQGDVAQERRVHEGMTADTAIEFMPAASLKRLQARIEELDTRASAGAQAERPDTVKSVRRPLPWLGLMAASIAVMAVALSVLIADRWLQYRVRGPGDYYTVTTSAPRAAGETIRAVFVPSITLVELQAILDEAQLRIIAGPSEAGVYSLAATSTRPASSSLSLLRAHSNVRFAESTHP